MLASKLVVCAFLLLFCSQAFAFFGLFERQMPPIIINNLDVNGEDVNVNNLWAVNIDANSIIVDFLVGRNYIDLNILNDINARNAGLTGQLWVGGGSFFGGDVNGAYDIRAKQFLWAEGGKLCTATQCYDIALDLNFFRSEADLNTIGFVPYVGAGSNVDLGAYDFATTGSGRFDRLGLNATVDPLIQIKGIMSATDNYAINFDGTTNPYTGDIDNVLAPKGFKMHRKFTGKPYFAATFPIVNDFLIDMDFDTNPGDDVLSYLTAFRNEIKMQANFAQSGSLTMRPIVSENIFEPGTSTFGDDDSVAITGAGNATLEFILSENKLGNNSAFSNIFTLNKSSGTVTITDIGLNVLNGSKFASLDAGATVNRTSYVAKLSGKGYSDAQFSGTDNITSTRYGLYIDNITGANNNYGIVIAQDDVGLTLGAGKEATLLGSASGFETTSNFQARDFNGTNMALDGGLTLNGTPSVIDSPNEIHVKANGDLDDYIAFVTAGGSTKIDAVGSTLYFDADGSGMNFLNNDLSNIATLNTVDLVASDDISAGGKVTVNTSGSAQDYLTLNGSIGGSPPSSIRGGGISLSNGAGIVGQMYANLDYRFVWDTTKQASSTDTGNAWLNLQTGAVSFAGHNFTISSTGQTAIDGDNVKLLLGEAGDASLYYDAVNMLINPKEVGGGILKILGDVNAETAYFESAKIGDLTNFTNFASDGRQTMLGTARYKLGFEIDNSGFKEPPAQSATLVNRGIGTAYEFSDGQSEHIHAEIRITGRWVDTEDLTVILLWDSPTVSEDCNWEITYLFRTFDEDMSEENTEGTISCLKTSSSNANGLVHSTCTIPTIDFNPNDKILQLEIWRNGDDPADTLGDSAYLHTMIIQGIADELGGVVT